jgi:DNA-directed RNA polymerase specialized sigma24 family protein
MSDDSAPSLIPPQPIPEGAQAFSERVRELMDGRTKEDADVARALEGMDAIFDRIAAGLYTLASMLVGEGEESVQLVELAISTAPASAASDPAEGRRICRSMLCGAAIEVLARRDAGALAAPQKLQPGGGCIDNDDLDAAAESRLEFERLIAGPERQRVRNWLAELRPDLRTVFVLRVAAGFNAQETADLIATHGGSQAAGWTPEAVREIFRQALCSLASQVLQATVQSSDSSR